MRLLSLTYQHNKCSVSSVSLIYISPFTSPTSLSTWLIVGASCILVKFYPHITCTLTKTRHERAKKKAKKRQWNSLKFTLILASTDTPSVTCQLCSNNIDLYSTTLDSLVKLTLNAWDRQIFRLLITQLVKWLTMRKPWVLCLFFPFLTLIIFLGTGLFRT